MSINADNEHFTSSNLFEHYDFSLIQNNNSLINREGTNIEDLVVFIALESLGTLAITLNICLCVVLLRHKYLHRASFVLMLSLALADVLHGLVTTCFFYPPILLRQSPVPSIGVKLFNILDWTAWSITLTHMSAICLDRLLAIMMYSRYNQFITVDRARKFTIFCWTAFFALNISYILAQFCCLITPLREIHFYTFGYGEFESEAKLRESPFGGANLFKLTYTPIELFTLTILSISNPITLIQLYRRHKRKMALRIQRAPPMGLGDAMLRRASTMLLEVSMRMGSKHINNNEVHHVASRRANRQQQRILLQISVVAIIFYLYMFAYYLLYHVLNVSNKWVVLFNSFFYSTTHMINPVIYFSLNKDMRAQLIRAISDFLHWLCCVAGDARLHAAGASSFYGRVKKGGGESSSGGSPLRKSSANELNSSAQPGDGWTLRLPTSCTTKRSWHQITRNTPNSSASERRHLLKINSNPPPSVASAPSCIEEQCQQETTTQQIQDSNNNIDIIIVNNHQNSQQNKSKNLAGIALNLVRSASREFNEEKVKKNKIFERIKGRSLFLNSKNYFIASEPNSSFNLERINKCLKEEDFEGEKIRTLSETLPISNFCLNNNNNENIKNQIDEIEENKIKTKFSSNELNNIVCCSSMLFQNYLKTEDSNEAITLDLVENWSVKENQEGQLEQKWHKETLDGLSRLRGLGSFLAEQLSNEADKCDKRWAIARRQRRTLIDSLILALKEESEEGKLKGEEDLNKKLDKLNSLKIEQKHPKRHSSNGWLFKINDDNISYSTTTKNYSNAPSCSSSEIISTKNEFPRYEFFENKKVKDKKSEEEADDEIETSGDDDIIYL